MKVDGVVLKSELKHCPISIQLPQKHILPMQRLWQSSRLFSFPTLVKQNPSIGIVVTTFPPGFFTLQCLQVDAGAVQYSWPDWGCGRTPVEKQDSQSLVTAG